MKQFYKQWNLSTRILLSVLIPVVLVAIGLVTYHMKNFDRHTLTELKKQSQIINRSISLAAEYALLSNNKDELLPFIEEVMLRPEIQNIAVFGEEKEVFIIKGKADNPKETLSFRLPITQKYINSDENDEAGLYIGSENSNKSNKKIGEIELLISLKPLRELQKESLLNSIIFAVFGVFCAITISIALMRSIQNPIRNIGDSLDKISTGDLSVRIKITDGGELGQLKDRCNWMIEQIEKNNEDLNKTLIEAENLKLEAENANELKSKFMAHISHDIRTPLSNMIMAIEAMENKVNDGPTTILYYLKYLMGSAKQQRLIVNDLLDWAKMEDGLYEIQQKWFAIKDTLVESVNAFSANALERNIDLQLDIIDKTNISESKVKGDAVNLIKILNNLISNAIKFTHKGSVTVSCDFLKHSKNQLLLTVSVQDSGIGIAEEDLKTIFEPFLQAKQEGKGREYGGSGLGLSIVKEIVEMMDGSVEIESKLRLGTIITVSIPYEYDIKSSLEKHTISAPLSNDDTTDETGKIMIVDDNLMTLELVKSSLEDKGFVVDIAENGSVAIDKYKGGGYSHILMDLDMPKVNGFEATKAIRALDKSRKTKIIALTANVVPGIKEKCISCGMNDYLEKPFENKELLEMLSKWNKNSAILINLR